MKTAVTKQNLDAGVIVHTGWSLGNNIASDCGVNVDDYFDDEGNFLGADCYGLAPTFEAAAKG